MIREETEGLKRAGLLLGWFLFQPSSKEVKRVVLEAKDYRILELESSERIYCIKLPELSVQEAEMLSSVFEEFKTLASPEFEELNNLEVFFEDYCEKNLVVVDDEQRNYLTELLRLMAFGFGPLSKLLENENLEEIAIIGLGRGKPVMVFDKKLAWLKTNFYYCNETEVKNAVNKMSRRLGKRLSLQNPRLNAMLPDGSRLSSSIQPVSFYGPNATIRKFGKKPFSPLDLIANNTASSEALAFLQIAFQTDSSVLIAGNTGSGKTSLLNALFCFVPASERIIAVEETPELNLTQEHLVKLNVSDGLKLGMKDLIVDSLRMRPDRIIVGEVRNSEEVLAFVDTMLAGQGKGSYCTFHAQNSRDALTRLQKLGVLGIDLLALDLIIVQRRWTSIEKDFRLEKRRITEIVEILDDNGKLRVNSLFEFDFARDCLRKVNESQRIKEKFLKATSAGSGIEFEKALASNALRLEGMKNQGLGIEEFVKKLNRQ